MVSVVATMSDEDRGTWIEACARMEVVQSGNPRLGYPLAVRWAQAYYWKWGELASKYAPDYDTSEVILLPSSGNVMVES